jgi:hypothetical protein
MAKSSRPRLSVPYDGIYPHREHRAKKNRSKNGNRRYRMMMAARKKEIEIIKTKETEYEKN